MYPYEVDPKDTVYFMLMFSHEWSIKHGLANRKRDKRGYETYVMCKSKCLKKSIGASLLFHIDARPFSCCSIDAQWRAPTDGAPTGSVANERQTPCGANFPMQRMNYKSRTTQ